jgi:KaiC/GvpD/RAD55 family RecA-like ATPase
MARTPELAYSTRRTKTQVIGFDDLFYPGFITWPGRSSLKILIRGEEGSGKSTLAVQIAAAGRSLVLEPEQPREPQSRCVLYYVVDDVPERIVQKFERFDIARYGVELYTGNYIPNNGQQPSVSWSEPPGSHDKTQFVLIGYGGPPTLSGLTDLVRKDVKACCDFDDCVVVFDSIPSLWLGEMAFQKAPDQTTGQVAHARVMESRPISRLELFHSRLPSLVSCGGDSSQRAESAARLPKPSVLIFVDEESVHDVGRDPYLTDVYITLWQGDKDDIKTEGYCERYLQVVKVANCQHVRGPQLFRISDGKGFEVMRSLQAIVGLLYGTGKRPEASRPVKLGIDRLDVDLSESKQGCLLSGSSSVLIGPAGTLKTPLAMLFCKAGLKEDGGVGKAIFLSLHERPAVLRDFALRLRVFDDGACKEEELCLQDFPDPFNFDHVNPDKHRFIIQHLVGAFMPPEGFIGMLERLFARLGLSHAERGVPPTPPKVPVRLVIDAISDINMNFPRLTERKGFFSLLLNTLYAYGVTTLFVFNETSPESSKDKTIEGLVDNTFRLERASAKGKPHVLLHAVQIGNRFPIQQQVFELLSKTETVRENEVRETIEAEWASQRFYVNENGRLVPAGLKLYFNKCSDAQAHFNAEIRRMYEVAPHDLNEELVHAQAGVYGDLLDRLRERRDCAIIAAVDVAYLAPEIKKKFLALPQDLLKPGEEEQFIDISSICTSNKRRDERPHLEVCREGEGNDRSLRVLPSYVDCSLVLCNLKLLQECAGTGKLAHRVHQRIQKEQRKTARDSTRRPRITMDEFKQLAQEFWKRPADQNSTKEPLPWFFGFSLTTNPEALVCMFLEWLGACRTLPDARHVSIHDTGSWVRALSEFAKLYLPPRNKADYPRGQVKTPDKCLFFHTWHSLVYGENLIDHCVVEVVENRRSTRGGENWRSTRGGWCWGVLDNGMGTQMAVSVLESATNELMNAYRIAQRVGIPPRAAFCQDTGEPTIYNLGLMKRIIENEAWSRHNVDNYPRVSAYLYTLFHQYLLRLDRAGELSSGNEAQVTTWLQASVEETKRQWSARAGTVPR